MRHISSIENTSDGHTACKQIEENPFGKGYGNETSEICFKLSHYIIVNCLEWFISLLWLSVVVFFFLCMMKELDCVISGISINLNILNCRTKLCSDVVSSQLIGVFVLGPFGRVSGTSQCQTLPVTGPGLPTRSCKVIHGWWLSLLGWVCGGEAKLHIKPSFHENWAWFFSWVKKGQGTLSPLHPESCWLLIRLSYWKELLVVHELCEAGSQWATR